MTLTDALEELHILEAENTTLTDELKRCKALIAKFYKNLEDSFTVDELRYMRQCASKY